MKKNEKKHILQFVKMCFFKNFFLVGPLALHFKDDF